MKQLGFKFLFFFSLMMFEKGLAASCIFGDAKGCSECMSICQSDPAHFYTDTHQKETCPVNKKKAEECCSQACINWSCCP